MGLGYLIGLLGEQREAVKDDLLVSVVRSLWISDQFIEN